MSQAAQSQRFTASHIEAFITAAFVAVEVPNADAVIVAQLMAGSDLIGADAHGIFRLSQYVARIQAGGVNVHPNIRIVSERPATALIDGDNGLGHLVVKKAVDTAIAKAATEGVAWVGTVNSNHAGPAGLYTRMALDHHMIGIYGAVANVNALPPWGGNEPLLSTNPISIAVPASGANPLVLDMATTTTSFGKIRLAAEKGESIPEGWVIGKDGSPITDPKRVNDGFLAAIGGAKGSGLALMLALLAGGLNGAAMGRDTVDMNNDLETPTNTGQFICVVDVAAFGATAQFEHNVGTLADDLRGSSAIDPAAPVRLPGDEAARKEAEFAQQGIPLAPNLVANLNKMATDLGIEQFAQ